METGGETSAAILKALKFSPRGLSITDIAKKTGKDRNSVAKLLEVLRAEGKIEVRTIGSARVYSLSQRVPLSAFLCFTRNNILIVDRGLNIVQANDKYLAMAGFTKDELIGRNILDLNLPVVSTPEALKIIGATGKEQVTGDIRSLVGSDESFFRMEVIPTTFEAGETGFTLVFEDITEQKSSQKNMEFLARTAMELVDMSPEADIYQYIADRISELLPGANGFVDSYDQENRMFVMRAIFCPAFREGLYRMIGRDVVGMSFRVDDLSGAPHHDTVSTVFLMQEHNFGQGRSPEDWSFYDLCFRQIPKEVCHEIVGRFNIGKVIGISITWKDHLFGVAGIFLPPGHELNDPMAVESFVRQASIAISRRMTEERLSQSEENFRELILQADRPTAIIGPEGRISLINPAFTEFSGYTLVDLPTLEDLCRKVFTDPGVGGAAISFLHHPGNEPPPPGIYPFRSRQGAELHVVLKPVILADGTTVLSCDVIP
ncbi:PAS domain S-box-containing protein [Methanolinea mesophila]|uniref:PAS domain S-box protein n=1 Tax=Methanolinea mesophila TaxID=547055 RepID=UPI001AE9D222|nr:PAS domain S-box protein [Methanolinea mesophila]MBP1929965.1 PAS domain S-box-containing protein [Methanolinea mesophila]